MLYLYVDQKKFFTIYCSHYPPDYLMIMSKTIFKNATKKKLDLMMTKYIKGEPTA